MKFGDVPTWVATVIAAISVYALWRTNRFNQQMIELERGRDLQAVNVSGWAERSSLAQNTTITPTHGMAYTYIPWVKSVVSNDSRQPIYNVVAIWMKAESSAPGNYFPLGTCSVDLIPPGRKYTQQLRSDSMAHVFSSSDAGETFRKKKRGTKK
jgi:hypothetical protein